MLQLRNGFVGVMHPPRLDVFQSLACIFDQQQVNSLAFQHIYVMLCGGPSRCHEMLRCFRPGRTS